MKIYFDTLHLYYIAQYMPVANELKNRRHQVSFIFYREPTFNELLKEIIREEGIDVIWVDNQAQARNVYLRDKPDWLIVGNLFSDLAKIHQATKTLMMQHGIGPKACYYEVSKSLTTSRLVEGKHRLARLQSMFPDGHFVDTPYAKLDPIIKGTVKPFDLAAAGLDPQKKTLLYAPTFYPSSINCLPSNWPEQLSEFNLIVKPHYFSLTHEKYKSHRKQFFQWAKYSNVFVGEFNDHSLLPFMATADLLLSDASSALFEFIALDKPAIWCDFYKLRWSYRGPLSFRMKQRLDPDQAYFAQVAKQVKSAKELNQAITYCIKHPNEQQLQRLNYTKMMVGKVDGKASIRAVDHIESYRENCQLSIAS